MNHESQWCTSNSVTSNSVTVTRLSCIVEHKSISSRLKHSTAILKIHFQENTCPNSQSPIFEKTEKAYDADFYVGGFTCSLKYSRKKTRNIFIF